MMMQTIAIFVDAYRELNAKKLFWFVLMLSGLFVAGLACVGLDQRGITILWWSVEVPIFNAATMPHSLFYKYWFYGIGFKVWLTWAATILALISTAGIFPDFISGGSIDLSLSKPISRARLFLTKYFAALLFVALQVGIFSALAFIVLRARGGTWVPEIFLAIPLVLVFFSYLFSFCVLIGLLTRSTVAALLLTILFWILIFLVHIAETGVVLQFKIRSEQSAAIRQADLERREEALAALKARPEPEEAAEQRRLLREISEAEETIARRRTRLESVEKTRDNLNFAHSILYGVKTVCPKTSETMELLGRALISESEMRMFEPPTDFDADFGDNDRDLRVSGRLVGREVQKELRSRSVWWVLGTSLLFEGAVLGLCVWIFARRDF